MEPLAWTGSLTRLFGFLLLTTLTAAAAFGQSETVAKPEPALPAGQVWQCTVDGQKTFSDKRCGAGASIRQINDVNRMDPTPVPRIHFYESGASYPARGAPEEDAGQPVSSDPIYATAVIVNRLGNRPRPRHPHRRAQAHK